MFAYGTYAIVEAEVSSQSRGQKISHLGQVEASLKKGKQRECKTKRGTVRCQAVAETLLSQHQLTKAFVQFVCLCVCVCWWGGGVGWEPQSK